MKKSKSLPKLKADLQTVFNSYIRERDKDQPCISCNQYKPLQAGHFFAVKGYDGLRFDEDNVHGECSGCNCFDHSHLIFFAERLRERIGIDNLVKLHNRAASYKMHGYKWSRSELIEKIEYYKQKIKDL